MNSERIGSTSAQHTTASEVRGSESLHNASEGNVDEESRSIAEGYRHLRLGLREKIMDPARSFIGEATGKTMDGKDRLLKRTSLLDLRKAAKDRSIERYKRSLSKARPGSIKAQFLEYKLGWKRYESGLISEKIYNIDNRIQKRANYRKNLEDMRRKERLTQRALLLIPADKQALERSQNSRTEGFKQLVNDLVSVDSRMEIRKDIRGQLKDMSAMVESGKLTQNDPEYQQYVTLREEVRSWGSDSDEGDKDWAREQSDAALRKYHSWQEQKASAKKSQKFSEVEKQINQKLVDDDKIAHPEKYPRMSEEERLRLIRDWEPVKRIGDKITDGNSEEFVEWVKEDAAWDINKALNTKDETVHLRLQELGILIDELNKKLDSANELDAQIAAESDREKKEQLTQDEEVLSTEINSLQNQIHDLYDAIEKFKHEESLKINNNFSKREKVTKIWQD